MSSHEKSYRHRTVGDRSLAPETQMMGYGYEPGLSEGAVKMPDLPDLDLRRSRPPRTARRSSSWPTGCASRTRSEEPGLIYSRINNPDLQILEDRLTLWDGAEAALVFASGMAAISTTLLTFLRPGDVLVHSEPVYGGTEFLVENVLPQFGIEREAFGALPGRADARAGARRRRGRAAASA